MNIINSIIEYTGKLYYYKGRYINKLDISKYGILCKIQKPIKLPNNAYNLYLFVYIYAEIIEFHLYLHYKNSIYVYFYKHMLLYIYICLCVCFFMYICAFICIHICT